LIRFVLIKLELFGLASGARLNKTKTSVLMIGSWANWKERSDLFDLQWTKGPQKIYGILFNSNGIDPSSWNVILNSKQLLSVIARES
jgi:hypothetical protein